VNELIFTFIWNSPVHRVKKELLQKDFCEGGLKMINLNLFILALKTTWVRKLFRTEGKWDNILFSTINQEKLFNFGPACFTAEIILLNFIIFFEMLNFPLIDNK
jgi:hypothetical protein